METENKTKKDYSLPASILIAALLISGSLIYNVGKKSNNNDVANFDGVEKETASLLEKVQSVGATDHILGNTSAAVKVIEFSDLECPFCKVFHKTMEQAFSEFNASGKNQIAWVYRHFPLDSLHPKAAKEAEATECATELGGRDMFWKYVKEIFAVTPSNNGLDLAELPNIAGRLGLDKNKFTACLESGKYKSLVDANVADALASGGRGTPFTIVISKKGKKFLINGAEPYSQVQATLSEALDN